MSTDIKRFGYEQKFEFLARKLYKKNINVFVVFYYCDITTHELKESEFSLLPKQDSESKNILFDTSLNELDNVGSEFSLKQNLEMCYSSKHNFDSAFNEIRIKNIFPHNIIQTFFYTDNRTVIPKQFLPPAIIEIDNQLTFNF